MIFFQQYVAQINGQAEAAMQVLASALSPDVRPLIGPALASQANVLGLAPSRLRTERPRSVTLEAWGYGAPPDFVSAEVFTDRTNLYVVAIRDHSPATLLGGVGAIAAPSERATQLNVGLYYIGGTLDSPRLQTVKSAVDRAFNVTLQLAVYQSNRFKELQEEGRTPPLASTERELAASRAFSDDRRTQMLATTIKAAGGLLVRDLPKQLAAEDRDRVQEIRAVLESHRLVDAEIVVVCRKTQAQVTRVPSREMLQRLSSEGVKCACGRPIGEEQIEESLTITDLGRALLDGNRWLTLLLVDELQQVGVPLSSILTEQQMGGDEVDCLADISGELTFFELKDKEFNLGNAYSFGAKMGIIRPTYPVIFTTHKIGGDAREHFERARQASRRRMHEWQPATEPSEIRYIEGLGALRAAICELAGHVYRNDAIRILDQALPFCTMNARALLSALERPPSASS